MNSEIFNSFTSSISDTELSRKAYIDTEASLEFDRTHSRSVLTSIVALLSASIGVFVWINDGFGWAVLTVIGIVALGVVCEFVTRLTVEKRVSTRRDRFISYLTDLHNELKVDFLIPFIKRYELSGYTKRNLEDLSNLLKHKLSKDIQTLDLEILIHFHERLAQMQKYQLMIESSESEEELFLRFFEETRNTIEDFEENLEEMPEVRWFLEQYITSKKLPVSICVLYSSEPQDIIDHFVLLWNGRDVVVNSFQKFEDRFLEQLLLTLKREQAKGFERMLNRSETIQNIIDDMEYSMTPYEFEELVAKLMEKQGYRIIVTKKSGDQGGDVVLEKEGVKTVVQVKKYAGKVGNKAIQEVVGALKFYDADHGWVVATAEYTKSAMELAKANGVKLINKTDLEKMIEKYW